VFEPVPRIDTNKGLLLYAALAAAYKSVFIMTLALTKKDFNEDSKILNDEGLEQPGV